MKQSCNWVNKQCEIPLKEDEKICPHCKGRGGQIRKVSFRSKNLLLMLCLYCHGSGKLDWVRQITQRPRPFGRFDSERFIYINFKCKRGKHCKVIKRAIKEERCRIFGKDEEAALRKEMKKRFVKSMT